MAITSQTNVEDFGDMTIRAKAIELTDGATIATDLTISDDLTVTGDTTLAGILSVDLTNIPTYADQAAGAAALAAGRVFKITTTGALHVALT